MTVAADPWAITERDFPATAPLPEQLRFLLGYAILAPSTKNTQPWRFAVGEDTVRIYADRSRWQRVADADQRELYLSLGCALENLLVAAEHFGLGHDVRYVPPDEPDRPAVVVRLRPGGGRTPVRAHLGPDAILRRRTDSGAYKPDPIPESARRRLEACCEDERVALLLTDDPALKRPADELSIRADAMLFGDHSFRAELGYWSGQGVFSTPWLLARVGRLGIAYLEMGQTSEPDQGVLMGAAMFGLVGTRGDDRTAQIRAGQAFERLWLTACTLGLSLQPLSQAVEVPETRVELAARLPLRDVVPLQPFRLGYAARPERRRAPRRPLAEVLEPPAP